MAAALKHDIFLHTLLTLIAAGCLLSLVVGVWMLVKPDSLLRVSRQVNQWLGSAEKLGGLMKTPVRVERALYRNHRTVGALILAGASYILYLLVFNIKKNVLVSALSRNLNIYAAAWLVDALVLLLFVCVAMAAVFGLVLLIRPSLLKKPELHLNRWYIPEKRLRALGDRAVHTDELLARHTRWVGAFIVLGSVYTLAVLWRAWF